MADRPILFSAPMSRALVAGRKTETRRTIKAARVFATPETKAFTLRGDDLARALQGASRFRRLDGDGWFWEADAYGWQAPATRTGWMAHIGFAPGDRLWVREAWRVSNRWDGTKPGDLPARTMTVFMEAGGSIANQTGGSHLWRPSCWPEPGGMPGWAGRRRAGMFMPRWASRTMLLVKGVRVERLQSITADGAIAEGVESREVECADGVTRTLWFGVPHAGYEFCEAGRGPIQAYADLWDSINNPTGLCAEDNPRGWSADPWVVVTSFDVILQNIDEVKP